MEAFERGEYEKTATELEPIIDAYPVGDERRAELLYLQGVSYFYQKNFHDAEIALAEYLDRYPEGKYADRAFQDLTQARAAGAAPDPIAEERLQEAKDSIERLLEAEREHPTDPKIKYYLGNALYDLGQYREAGRYYFEAQALEAAYQEKDLIRQRLLIDDEGKPVAATPEMLRAIERDEHPIVVFDVVNYFQRSGQELDTARRSFFNVTGKVRNQGVRPIKGVELEIRFENALNQVLDVQIVRLGAMEPGDVRAFLAQASRYDNILNIEDYEILAREIK